MPVEALLIIRKGDDPIYSRKKKTGQSTDHKPAARQDALLVTMVKRQKQPAMGNKQEKGERQHGAPSRGQVQMNYVAAITP